MSGAAQPAVVTHWPGPLNPCRCCMPAACRRARVLTDVNICEGLKAGDECVELSFEYSPPQFV
eukprot:7132897-Prymnesium_polylepis.1